MSRLLGGVLFELVLILLNLDFEIDRSWMNLERVDGEIWQGWKNSTVQFAKLEYQVLAVLEQN
jgi:hypothetical protein